MPPSNGRQDEAMVQPYTSRAGRFYQERTEDSERKESNEIQRYCRGQVAYYYYLDSIKKGWKIRKGKNQTKSKDIAVAMLHTTT
jgi:hypothetical protein